MFCSTVVCPGNYSYPDIISALLSNKNHTSKYGHIIKTYLKNINKPFKNKEDFIKYVHSQKTNPEFVSILQDIVKYIFNIDDTNSSSYEICLKMIQDILINPKDRTPNYTSRKYDDKDYQYTINKERVKNINLIITKNT